MTKLYEFNGQMLTRGDIARLGNLPWYIVDQRLRYGWSIERIISTPVKQIKTTRPKQDICDEIDEYECLHCTRPKCIYDEDKDDRKTTTRKKNRARNDANRTCTKIKRKQSGTLQN